MLRSSERWSREAIEGRVLASYADMADHHNPPVLALTTVSGAEEADRLARLLVEQRLAACVNILPGVQSIYRWQGAIEAAAELLLIIKTSADLIPALQATLSAHHSYEVPEFVVLPIQAGSEPYLQWLMSNLR